MTGILNSKKNEQNYSKHLRKDNWHLSLKVISERCVIGRKCIIRKKKKSNSAPHNDKFTAKVANSIHCLSFILKKVPSF